MGLKHNSITVFITELTSHSHHWCPCKNFLHDHPLIWHHLQFLSGCLKHSTFESPWQWMDFGKMSYQSVLTPAQSVLQLIVYFSLVLVDSFRWQPFPVQEIYFIFEWFVNCYSKKLFLREYASWCAQNICVSFRSYNFKFLWWNDPSKHPKLVLYL